MENVPKCVIFIIPTAVGKQIKYAVYVAVKEYNLKKVLLTDLAVLIALRKFASELLIEYQYVKR